MFQLRNIALALTGLAATGLATTPAAAEAASSSSSKVHSLTTDTFKDFVKEHDLVLAEFFAPWCGHCKNLAPEYEAAAEELAEKDIPLVKVDCTQEMDLCREFGVQGYPTMKVFRGLDDIKPYGGARKASSISSYMIKQSLPAVTTIATADALNNFQALDKITIVGYISADDKASNDLFTKIAEELRDTYPFGVTSEVSLADAESVKAPAIALYKDFDEKKAVFTDKFEEDAIITFIKNAATPLVGVVAPETFQGYMSAGIPLAYIFAETQEERDEFATMFKPIAKEQKGKINIATIDAKAFGAHAEILNLKPEKFPAFAIHNVDTNDKYTFDQDKKITEKEVGSFISDVLAGKVEPSIKSQPVPEKQDGPVTVLVARNYKEFVNDDEKDVLVEFYAPWCGHCKALAPKYNELGNLYKNNDFSSKVTIAKIDATANDVPEDIAGFPTIKLFPAGSKSAPIDFNGKRTVEELANFIRDNGKHGVDAFAAAAEKAKEAAATAAEEEKEKTHEEKKEDDGKEEKQSESIAATTSTTSSSTSTATDSSASPSATTTSNTSTSTTSSSSSSSSSATSSSTESASKANETGTGEKGGSDSATATQSSDGVSHEEL